MSSPVTPDNTDRSKQLRPGATDLPPEMENLTEEEREEIFSQINEVATGGGFETRKDMFSFTPQKKGSFFPLLVNILAVLLMAGGIFYADRYFGRQEEQLNVESDAYLSAEGKIIEEFKKESEQRLEQKEQEIQDIQQNLEQIEQERQDLAQTMDQRIEKKEEELRAELEQSLREERARLEARGISEQELQNRMAEFEESRSSELNEAIASYRQEMQEEIRQKEQELAEAKATAERILEEANREKQELIEETERREQELRSEFEEERERLTARTSQAQEELEELSKLREREQLILDQISSMYLEIDEALRQEDPQGAMDRINELRELIDSPTMRRLPTLSERREVDNFLLNTLEEYVNKTQRSTGDTSSLLDSAKRLSSAKASVSQAQDALQEGDTYTAQRYFTQALSTIPELQTAHEEVSRINGLNRSRRIEELISIAEEERDAGNTEEAISRLTNAAAEASPFNAEKAREAATRLVGIMEAEYEQTLDARETEYEENREALQSRISELNSRLDRVNSELSSLEGQKTELRERSTGLQNQNERQKTRISELQSEKDDLQQRIQQLNKWTDQLEQRYDTVKQQYENAQERVDNLRTDLDAAAEEIASLASQTGTSTLLSDAVDRYSSFRERQSRLESTEEAQRKFDRFLQSEEISSIFPELHSLYRRSHPEE